MRSVIFIIVLHIAAVGCSQNLMPNPSFESPGSGTTPDSWSLLATSPNVTRTYMNTGGASQGSCYVRMAAASVVTGTNQYPGWEPTYYLPAVAGNRRYRVTYDFRRSHVKLLPVVKMSEDGTAISGNSASSFLDFAATDAPASLSTPVNTWGTRSIEFTTRIGGSYNISRTILLLSQATSAVGDPLPVSSTFDFDNIRWEELERFTTSSLSFSAGTAAKTLNYDIDLRIRWQNVTNSSTHSPELKLTAPTGLSGRTLAKYWIIPNITGTFQATPTFLYTDAELGASGIPEANLKLFRRDGTGVWAEVPSVLDAALNEIRTQSAVTSFSDWAIGEPAATSVKEWDAYR